MIEHELKTWTEYFEEVMTGNKTFEIRKDDRGYEVGDTLILRDYDPKTESYSGWEAKAIVTYCLRGLPFVPPNYVAMSICLVDVLPKGFEPNEQPNEVAAEEEVYGKDCRNGSCS